MLEKIDELLSPLNLSKSYSLVRYNDPANRVGFRISFGQPITDIDAGTEEELIEKAIGFLQPLFDARMAELEASRVEQERLDNLGKEKTE
jgi:hypothetical protein